MPLRWKKSLGQHLLHDHNILRKIVSELRLKERDHVIEIGCGSGALTQFLVKEDIRVTSIEIDPQFSEDLDRQFGKLQNFKLITGDILSLDLEQFITPKDKTVITGNLPYNITSQILFHLFDQKLLNMLMVFTVQKEVARRITARPSSKDRSILSILCQYYAIPKYLFSVSRNCFFPKPRVDSAVISLESRQLPGDLDSDNFMQVVKSCFGKRRKTLKNTISLIPNVRFERFKSEIDLTRRPEELSIEEFEILARDVENSRMEVEEIL